MRTLSWNVQINTFRLIRLLNPIIINTPHNKNTPETERSFKGIYVESKKYIQNTNLH